MPVDNNNIEFEGYLQYACNGCNLWQAEKGLPKFYFRQPLGNLTYSSPNLAILVFFHGMLLQAYLWYQ